MTATVADSVELLDVDGGTDDDVGEWTPTPDMEDEARFFNDDATWEMKMIDRAE
jgi:hypothetical protein